MVNVGKRQDGRLKAGNVINVEASEEAIAKGIVYVPEDRGKQGAITAMPSPLKVARRWLRVKSS